MTTRKKWARLTTPVKYCSQKCRSHRLRPVDHRLEAAILVLLEERSASSSICPSEAAQWVDQKRWRRLMEPCRMAARRLVASGDVEITQGYRVVDPSTAKGPIRIRRNTRPSAD